MSYREAKNVAMVHGGTDRPTSLFGRCPSCVARIISVGSIARISLPKAAINIRQTLSRFFPRLLSRLFRHRERKIEGGIQSKLVRRRTCGLLTNGSFGAGWCEQAVTTIHADAEQLVT